MLKSNRGSGENAVIALYALAAAASLFLYVAPSIGIRCPTCQGGVLSTALPWLGAIFYSALALLTVYYPRSRWLAAAPGFIAFVHGSLATEILLNRELCPGCLLVAASAIAAAIIQVGRLTRDYKPLLLALALGIASAFLSPYDRVDALITRTLWPSKILESAPSWISREEMSKCDHSSVVRILLFERDCKSCGSATTSIIPQLERDFGTQICVHPHDSQGAPPKQRLPLFVMVSQRMDVVILEGTPEVEQLKALLSPMVKRAGRVSPVDGKGTPAPPRNEEK